MRDDPCWAGNDAGERQAEFDTSWPAVIRVSHSLAWGRNRMNSGAPAGCPRRGKRCIMRKMNSVNSVRNPYFRQRDDNSTVLASRSEGNIWNFERICPRARPRLTFLRIFAKRSHPRARKGGNRRKFEIFPAPLLRKTADFFFVTNSPFFPDASRGWGSGDARPISPL